MKKVSLYLLVHDEPEGVKELTGMIRRQSESRFDVIALIPPDLSPPTKHMCEKVAKEIHVVEDGDAGSLINNLALSNNDDIVVVLDSGFMPSNQVWLKYLLEGFNEEECGIVIGRLAHDLYTNWFIQNDFKLAEENMKNGEIAPYCFQFGGFAVKTDILRKTPFPKGGIDEFALRWMLLNPGPVRFEKNVVTACLDAISVDCFVSSYSRLSRETNGLGKPFRESLKLFFKGSGRDITLMWEKKMPFWIFFSLYLRFRQAKGFLFPPKVL